MFYIKSLTKCVYILYILLSLRGLRLSLKTEERRVRGGGVYQWGPFSILGFQAKRVNRFAKILRKKMFLSKIFAFFCISFSREKGESFRDINNAKTLRK